MKRRGRSAGTGGTSGGAPLAFNQSSSLVEGDPTTALEGGAELGSSAHDARLHSRHREAKPRGHLGIGKLLELRQLQDDPVLRRKLLDDAPDRLRARFEERIVFELRRRCFSVDVRGPRRRVPPAVLAMVGDGAACHAVHPRAETFGVAQIHRATLESKPNILQDIGGGRRFDTTNHEGAKMVEHQRWIGGLGQSFGRTHPSKHSAR